MLTVDEACERIRRVILNEDATPQESANTPNSDPLKFWERIKQVMWDALRPFPDARVALAQALGALDEPMPT